MFWLLELPTLIFSVYIKNVTSIVGKCCDGVHVICVSVVNFAANSHRGPLSYGAVVWTWEKTVISKPHKSAHTVAVSCIQNVSSVYS